MKKDFLRVFFSVFFLSVFFIKMLLCAVPLIVSHFDSKAVNAVIMQLEEEGSEKGSEKVKENFFKEFCTTQYEFCFSNPLLLFSSKAFTVEDDQHIQLYYPSVPTPPPSV